MKNSYFFILFFVSTYGFAQKEQEISAEISGITVYNSSAEIHYHKSVSLTAGRNTIVFTDLTPYIVDNTINMSCTSPDVNIITVMEKINYIKERKEQNQRIAILQDSVHAISEKLGLLKCKKDALTVEKELLFHNPQSGGVIKDVSVADIEKASGFISKRYYEISKELYLLNNEEQSLNEKLNANNNQIRSLSSNTNKSLSEIVVTVQSTSAKKVDFDFKFLTTKAGWAPMYDCKFQGNNQPLKFIFRANVFNATGINWNDIKIHLSTASPTEGFDAPSLRDEKNNNQPKRNNVNNNDVKFIQLQVANSIAEYDIQHSYSIPSDSKPYLLDVASYDVPASFYYLLIPKMDAFGFLMAKIPDWNKYNLIPGVTNVYNKGSYMGKTFLNTYAENDTLNVYLGKDNTIQSTRKENNKENSNNIIGNYYVDKSSVYITVKNSSSDNIDIVLWDQVPELSGDEKIKFSPGDILSADYNREEGLLTWNFTLPGNETRVFDYKYEIRIPKSGIGSYKPKKRSFRTISCPSF